MATLLNNCLFFNEPPSRGPGDDDGGGGPRDPSGPGDGTGGGDDDGGSVDTPDDPDDPDDPDGCNGDPCTGGGGGGGGGGGSPDLIWVCRTIWVFVYVPIPPQFQIFAPSGVIITPVTDCIQIPRGEFNPATDSGPYNSKRQCDEDCWVWVCREFTLTFTTTEISSDLVTRRCVRVKRRDVRAGERFYLGEFDCKAQCPDDVFPRPGGGGGGGGSGPGTGGGGGSGPGTGTSGYNCVSSLSPGGQIIRQCVPTPSSPQYLSLAQCQANCTASTQDMGWACVEIPTGPQTGTNPSPPRKECRYVLGGPYSTQGACIESCPSGSPIRYICSSFVSVLDGQLFIFRECVSGTNPNYPYATAQSCQADCPSVSTVDGEGISQPDSAGGEYENLVAGEGDTGTSYLDPTYFVPPANQTYFESTRSTGSGNQIFSMIQDSSVNTLLNPRGITFTTLNRATARLNSSFIRKSIQSNISNILYNLKTPDGRRYPELKVTNSIKNRILEGTTSKIDYGYILKLAIRTILQNQEINTVEFNRFVNAQYGYSAAEIAKTRQETIAKLELLHKKTSALQYSPTPNENTAVSIALGKSRNIDYRRRNGLSKEFMKLWYVLPEDIYANVPVEEQNQNFYKIKVPNSELLNVQTSQGSTVTVNFYEYNYGLKVQTPTAFEDALPNTQLHRAHTLKNEDHQAALYHVKSKYSTELRVTSQSAMDLEISYALSTPLPTHYVLKIDKTTIEDIPYFGHPLVRKTKARYTRITDPQEIENAVKFRIYPWKVFPINYNDPILGHMDAQSTIELTYTNFSFEQFGDDLGGPILVRRVPKVVILIPTDRYDYLFFDGKSKLVDWNQRTLKFGLSQDKNYYNPGIRTNWVKLNYAYPNTDIEDNINNTGLKAEYVASAPVFTRTYVDGNQPERTEDSFRAAVRIASTLNATYNITNGLTWKDVYARLTPLQYTAIKRGIPDYMMNKLRTGEKTGVKLFHTQGYAGATKSRLVDLKNGQVDNLPIYIQDINE